MLGRVSSGRSRLARTVQIKIIFDAGQSEQADRLPDQRRRQPNSRSPTWIARRTDSGGRCTATPTASHPTNRRRPDPHRRIHQCLAFDQQPLGSVVGVLLVKVGLVYLESGNVQRLGQRDIAFLPCDVCCRADSFYPVLQLGQVSRLPCPHVPRLSVRLCRAWRSRRVRSDVSHMVAAKRLPTLSRTLRARLDWSRGEVPIRGATGHPAIAQRSHQSRHSGRHRYGGQC